MPRLRPMLNAGTRDLYGYRFDCPGCDRPHVVGLGWTFNGSFERPTFTPSVLVTRGGDPAYRCHSYVTDGRIAFLSDCSHALAGRTVDLPEVASEEAA
jgi:hypothetical protein